MRPLYVLLLCIVALSGCAGYVKAIKQRPLTPRETAINDALASMGDIEHDLPAYIKDEDMARLERQEIATVQADLEVAKRDVDANTFIDDVCKLSDDWDALVARDKILQVEELL